MAMSRHILHSGVWSGCCTTSPPHTSARLQYPLSRSRFQDHRGGSDWLPPQTSDASGHIFKTWFCQICTRGAIAVVRKYVACLSNLYLSCFISHQTLDVHFRIRTQIFTSTSAMLIVGVWMSCAVVRDWSGQFHHTATPPHEWGLWPVKLNSYECGWITTHFSSLHPGD